MPEVSSSPRAMGVPVPPGQEIFLLTQEFYPQRGGIATYVLELARALAAMGRDVHVLAPADDRLLMLDEPFAVHSLAVPTTQGWPSRVALARALRPWREAIGDATLVVAEAAALRAMCYWLAPAMPWPAVWPRDLRIVLHGTELVRLTRYPHRRRLFTGLLARASAVGVVSTYVADELQRRVSGVADLAARVVRVPGAVRSDLDPVESAPDDPGPMQILSVGRIHPRKGQLALVEAIAGLDPADRDRVRCRLAGPVSRARYAQRIQRVAAAAGVQLDLLGPVSDERLGELYASANVFAMTSMPAGLSVEGLGLVCLEASAHGLPVLAHRIGGVPEAVRDGLSGLLADPNDRTSLTTAIRTLLHDGALRRRLGAGGREHAATFSWERSARALVGL